MIAATMLFMRYLDTGTFEDEVKLKSSIKLSNENFLGKKRGGYKKSSLIGLNAWNMMNSIGNNEKTTIGARIM